jgi:hypothetical protein
MPIFRPARSFARALLMVAVVTACAPKKKPGDVCRASPSDAVCTDATDLGSCRAFTWHVDPCRGPGGCASGVCDQSVAAKDDSCGVLGARACSIDGKELLRCDGANMVVERTCRGERGCYRTSANATPSCDAGPAEVGDACTATMGSRCSTDGKSILQCSQQTHHMILERQCLGPKGCFKNPHFHTNGMEFLACDISVGDVGQPCIGYAGIGARIENGGSYCSTDGQELLTCQGGALVAKAPCACAVSWAADLASYGVGCEEPPSGPPRRTHTVGLRSAAFLSLADQS